MTSETLKGREEHSGQGQGRCSGPGVVVPAVSREHLVRESEVSGLGKQQERGLRK